MPKKLILLVLAALSAVFLSAPLVYAVTANTTISSAVSSTISVSSDGSVSINVLPTGSGAQTIGNDTATVSTNDSSGYTLTLSSSTTNNNLVSGSNNITPSSGTQASPVTQSANTWGYAVQGVGGFNSSGYANTSNSAISGSLKFAAVPSSSSPDTLVTTTGTAVNATTTVYYAVAVNTSQPSGTYTQTVTYTATAN